MSNHQNTNMPQLIIQHIAKKVDIVVYICNLNGLCGGLFRGIREIRSREDNVLTLREVSKYYARNGQVALGLRKINAEFKLGEFVAIVGESGSGKSTLLNVLSGIDSYEEGEMLINEQQTSHYTMQDWEEYRKHYIGFVFQNYNIIDSFTVYQNVEAALQIAGYPPAQRKERVLELIKRVGLERYVHTKASKLSGGQMQRTAIARALAKDCPIIIADEPTGNLDSESSKQMIDLLAEISQNKLVIMVTHNIEEVEHAITRKITLHDGHIVDDQQLRPNRSTVEGVVPSTSSGKENKLVDFIRLSLQFVTATPIKSLLIFTVLLLLCLGSAFIYGNMLTMKSSFNKNPQSMYFPNSSERRIVLHHTDLRAITPQEVEQLQALEGVQEWIAGDVALDISLLVELPKQKGKDIVTVAAGVSPWSLIDPEQLAAGSLPQQSNEIVLNTLALRKGFQANDLLNHEITLSYNNESYKVKIVGIAENSKISEMVYLSAEMINSLAVHALNNYQVTSFSMDPLEDAWFTPAISSDANRSVAHASLNYAVFQQYCAAANTAPEQCREQIIGNPIHIDVINSYTTVQHTFTVIDIEEHNIEEAEPIIYFSPAGLELFNTLQEPYQGSIIIKRSADPQAILNQLQTLGYKAIYPYETVQNNSPFLAAIQLLALVGFVVIFVGIFFFIAYFILKTTMKSKQKDYIIMRSIGASSGYIHITILLELIWLSTAAYVTGLLIVKLSQWLPAINSLSWITNLFKYYAWYDYFVMYLIVMLMTVLLVNRMKKQLSSGSILTILKGE